MLNKPKIHALVWKNVILDGFKWPYQVSSNGQVRRAEPGPHTRVGRLLKPNLFASGYYYVGLRAVGRKRRWVPVHRLVALAFLRIKKGHPHVNHIDGEKTNNHVTNLEWSNPHHNMAHAKAIGLLPKKSLSRKLTDNQVQEIRSTYTLRQRTLRFFAERFGVGTSTIYRVLRGEYYAN